MSMTWKDVKDMMDKAGVKDEDHIFYFDTGDYPEIDEVSVSKDKDGDNIVFSN